MTINDDEKFVLLTTYKRDGSPVATPVWWVNMGDGTFAFWTSSGSGKAKRLAHTGRVTVQPCNPRGVVKPGSSAIEGTAHVVSGPELEAIRGRVVAKYGMMTKLTKLTTQLTGALKRKQLPYADRGVVVTLVAA